MRRARDPEDSRRRLIASARALFATRGIRGTTVDAVADGAGISRGSVFWHFGSKEGLLWAVVEDALEEFATAVTERVGDRVGLDALRTFVDGRRETLASDSEQSRLTYVLMGEAMSGHAELAEALSRYREQYLAMFEKWLRAGVEIGELAADIDPRAIAEVFQNAMQAATQWWLLDPEAVDIDLEHRRVLDVVERACLA